MLKNLLALASLAASVSAVYQGFNYGPTNSDGSVVVQSEFTDLFTTAQQLVGTSGFTSARLYTMIQGGTANTPTEAIPAAITTNTTLLLGLWASAGDADFANELAALSAAITQYGTPFTDLIAGISVGSEDLYRDSVIGTQNLAGIGVGPSVIVGYIQQVRSAIAGTAASAALVGHVDTWTAWVNGSNTDVITNCDFLGMDAYPYFQNTEANGIDVGYDVFFAAYNATEAYATGKPVWITETGWPVSGPTENLAVASVPNAQTYWDQVGCDVFGKINTWWFTLQDSYPDTPSPSFGIVGSTLGTTPLYSLTCPS
jgi:glucan endo-1,3-beta-D-glucosidase